jgi:hypothetical protein
MLRPGLWVAAGEDLVGGRFDRNPTFVRALTEEWTGICL